MNAFSRIGALLAAPAFGAVLLAGVAHAQSPTPRNQPQQAPAEKIAPSQQDVPGGSAHDGVIKPPPQISTPGTIVPPTSSGRMPVIPPPGDGADQPNVTPK